MKLIISETESSTWSYHLRLVEKGKEKYGGGAGKALCGKKLGWDTEISLSSYASWCSYPCFESYCKECFRIAKEQNLPGVEEIPGRMSK